MNLVHHKDQISTHSIKVVKIAVKFIEKLLEVAYQAEGKSQTKILVNLLFGVFDFIILVHS
jgi:hypothetical protein